MKFIYYSTFHRTAHKAVYMKKNNKTINKHGTIQNIWINKSIQITLYVKTKTFKWILEFTGSQCKECRMLTWANGLEYGPMSFCIFTIPYLFSSREQWNENYLSETLKHSSTTFELPTLSDENGCHDNNMLHQAFWLNLG